MYDGCFFAYGILNIKKRYDKKNNEGAIMDVDKLRNELLSQNESGFKGNVYHWAQVSFAYNSNKIEGSRLSEKQTEMIYGTHSFIAKSDESIEVDDLLET